MTKITGLLCAVFVVYSASFCVAQDNSSNDPNNMLTSTVAPPPSPTISNTEIESTPATTNPPAPTDAAYPEASPYYNYDYNYLSENDTGANVDAKESSSGSTETSITAPPRGFTPGPNSYENTESYSDYDYLEGNSGEKGSKESGKSAQKSENNSGEKGSKESGESVQKGENNSGEKGSKESGESAQKSESKEQSSEELLGNGITTAGPASVPTKPCGWFKMGLSSNCFIYYGLGTPYRMMGQLFNKLKFW